MSVWRTAANAYTLHRRRVRAKTPAPSRNAYGVTALDVGALESGDRCRVNTADYPQHYYHGAIRGDAMLYFPGPYGGYYVLRDFNGAPGPAITSIEVLDDEDDE